MVRSKLALPLLKNVKKKLVAKIGEAPEKYYVNLHTKRLPNRAVRGQLEPIVRAQ